MCDLVDQGASIAKMRPSSGVAGDGSLKESEYLFHLAQVAASENKIEGAIDLMTRAVTINPINALYQNVLGELLMKDQRFRQALEIFKKAFALQPDAAEICLNMARAADGLHDQKAAAEYYAQAAALKPACAKMQLNVNI